MGLRGGDPRTSRRLGTFEVSWRLKVVDSHGNCGGQGRDPRTCCRLCTLSHAWHAKSCRPSERSRGSGLLLGPHGNMMNNDREVMKITETDDT